jgi:hypothetical protein
MQSTDLKHLRRLDVTLASPGPPGPNGHARVVSTKAHAHVHPSVLTPRGAACWPPQPPRGPSARSCSPPPAPPRPLRPPVPRLQSAARCPRIGVGIPVVLEQKTLLLTRWVPCQVDGCGANVAIQPAGSLRITPDHPQPEPTPSRRPDSHTGQALFGGAPLWNVRGQSGSITQ